MHTIFILHSPLPFYFFSFPFRFICHYCILLTVVYSSFSTIISVQWKRILQKLINLVWNLYTTFFCASREEHYWSQTKSLMLSSSTQWHVVPQLNHKCAGLYALKRATLTSCVQMLNLLMHAVLHSIIIITEIIPGRVSFIVTAFSNCSLKQNEGKILNLILIGCREHCYILLGTNLSIGVSSCNLSYCCKLAT